MSNEGTAMVMGRAGMEDKNYRENQRKNFPFSQFSYAIPVS